MSRAKILRGLVRSVRAAVSSVPKPVRAGEEAKACPFAELGEQVAGLELDLEGEFVAAPGSAGWLVIIAALGVSALEVGAHLALITARGTRSPMVPLTRGRVLLRWTVIS
jgi:hypothetical protein